jgi:hypothetical protein
VTRFWYWRWRLLGKEPEVCLGCGQPLTQHAAAWCHAAAGQVELSLQGLPFRACDNGCADRRQPRPGFVAELQHSLLEGGHLPMAQPATQGGALSCYACANRVWAPGPEVGDATGTLSFPGLPSIGVTVRGPIRTCNGCGRIQLIPSESVRAALTTALAEAVAAAGVRSTYRRP